MSKNFIKNKKILVAMSGGVDSSVAAALLKEQGYEVIGVTLQLFCSNRENKAAAVAKKLGLRHYLLDLRQFFQECVVKNFVDEYKQGRTPNPCTRCNPYVKFDHLLREAYKQDAAYIATGHYARIEDGRLLKGKDRSKDQSYMLYRLNQEQLARSIFPLGTMNKTDVKHTAKEFGLPVDQAESQDICFIKDNDYGRFLKDVCPEAVRPGPILDRQGNIVGLHGGIAFYTIGQRKGIGSHRGLAKYVIQIDRERNAIVIGNQEDTLERELIADQINYVSGQSPFKPLEVTAKIRYNSPEVEVVLQGYPDSGLSGDQGKVKIIFKEPQRAITPGQSVVFYKGEEVVGGGIIQ